MIALFLDGQENILWRGKTGEENKTVYKIRENNFFVCLFFVQAGIGRIQLPQNLKDIYHK